MMISPKITVFINKVAFQSLDPTHMRPHLDPLSHLQSFSCYVTSVALFISDYLKTTLQSIINANLSIGLGNAMKTGSSRRFKRYPTTYK